MTADRHHERQEGEPLHLDPTTIAVTDLDRTLILSDNLADLVYETIRTDDTAARVAQVRQTEKQQKGNAFSYLEALEQQGIAIDPRELAQQVIAKYSDKNGSISQELITTIMIPGALDFLDQVHEAGAGLVIMTAGEAKTQLFKIYLLQTIARQVAGISLDSYIIVPDKDAYGRSLSKANLLDASYSPTDGRFDMAWLMETYGQKTLGSAPASSIDKVIQSTKFARAVIVDDKRRNVTQSSGLNPHLVGVLVRPDNKSNGEGENIADLADAITLAEHS